MFISLFMDVLRLNKFGRSGVCKGIAIDALFRVRKNIFRKYLTIFNLDKLKTNFFKNIQFRIFNLMFVAKVESFSELS